MYELGVLAALLLWLWRAIWRIVAINSTFERNLNRVGQRLSWLTLTPKAVEPEELNQPKWRAIGKYLFLTFGGLPFVLLSWLSVASWLATVAYFKWKDAGVPQRIKEVRWKMRNVEMSFDQICRELQTLSERSDVPFEQFRSQLATELAERGLNVG